MQRIPGSLHISQQGIHRTGVCERQSTSGQSADRKLLQLCRYANECLIFYTVSTKWVIFSCELLQFLHSGYLRIILRFFVSIPRNELYVTGGFYGDSAIQLLCRVACDPRFCLYILIGKAAIIFRSFVSLRYDHRSIVAIHSFHTTCVTRRICLTVLTTILFFYVIGATPILYCPDLSWESLTWPNERLWWSPCHISWFAEISCPIVYCLGDVFYSQSSKTCYLLVARRVMM